MSDVKINPNIRPIQPAKEKDSARRSDRAADSNFNDVMAEVQRGTKEVDKSTGSAGQITDRASVDKAMEQAAAAHRDMMRIKGLLEQAARMQTGKTDSSNKS